MSDMDETQRPWVAVPGILDDKPVGRFGPSTRHVTDRTEEIIAGWAADEAQDIKEGWAADRVRISMTREPLLLAQVTQVRSSLVADAVAAGIAGERLRIIQILNRLCMDGQTAPAMTALTDAINEIRKGN